MPVTPSPRSRVGSCDGHAPAHPHRHHRRPGWRPVGRGDRVDPPTEAAAPAPRPDRSMSWSFAGGRACRPPSCQTTRSTRTRSPYTPRISRRPKISWATGTLIRWLIGLGGKARLHSRSTRRRESSLDLDATSWCVLEARQLGGGQDADWRAGVVGQRFGPARSTAECAIAAADPAARTHGIRCPVASVQRATRRGDNGAPFWSKRLDEVRDALSDDEGKEVCEILTSLDSDLGAQQQRIEQQPTRIVTLLDSDRSPGVCPRLGRCSRNWRP